MSEPIVVTISHRLGKEEALRRLKKGLADVPSSFGPMFRGVEQRWSDDELRFTLSAFTQVVSGTITVAEDHVRLELSLPWLLAKFAAKLPGVIQREGRLLLEKK
jgi:putative polyhydroxyalkanoic acid system protein